MKLVQLVQLVQLVLLSQEPFGLSPVLTHWLTGLLMGSLWVVHQE
jgi:hypothetical protein